MIRNDISRWLEAAEQNAASNEVTAKIQPAAVIKRSNIRRGGTATSLAGVEAPAIDANAVNDLRRELDSLRVQVAISEQATRLTALEAASRTPDVIPPRRTGKYLAAGALLLLLAGGAVVGVRAYEINQERDAAAAGTASNATMPTLPGVLPNGESGGGTTANTTGPIYTLANTGAGSSAAGLTTGIFKPSVVIPEADMIGGMDPNGKLNPDSLGFVPTDVVYDFELIDAQSKNIPACGGNVLGAAYEVTATNAFGPLGADAVRTSLASLATAEQIKVFQGLYNVADQATLSRAISNSYLMFFDANNNELAEVNGCTELNNG